MVFILSGTQQDAVSGLTEHNLRCVSGENAHCRASGTRPVAQVLSMGIHLNLRSLITTPETESGKSYGLVTHLKNTFRVH